MLAAEEIKLNWEKLRRIVNKKLSDDENINRMLDSIEDNFSTAPASCKKNYHCAFPGGLVDHSLRVLTNAMQLAPILTSDGQDIPVRSIVLTSLFHDLGKCCVEVNEKIEDLYIDQPDKWRRETLGEMYSYNKNAMYMTIPMRSIYTLAKYGVNLTQDEYVSIIIHDGFSLQENKPYMFKEPQLATVLMTADYFATLQEKIIYKADI